MIRLAGFWVRLVAHTIDTVVLTIAGGILSLILLKAVRLAAPSLTQATSPVFAQMVELGLYLCLAFPYYTWSHYRWGATLGKRMLHIKVVQMDSHAPLDIGQSILRTFGYGLSYLPMMAGFLMAALHPEKRALHDLIGGTISIRSDEWGKQNAV